MIASDWAEYQFPQQSTRLGARDDDRVAELRDGDPAGRCRPVRYRVCVCGSSPSRPSIPAGSVVRSCDVGSVHLPMVYNPSLQHAPVNLEAVESSARRVKKGLGRPMSAKRRRFMDLCAREGASAPPPGRSGFHRLPDITRPTATQSTGTAKRSRPSPHSTASPPARSIPGICSIRVDPELQACPRGCRHRRPAAPSATSPTRVAVYGLCVPSVYVASVRNGATNTWTQLPYVINYHVPSIRPTGRFFC